MAAKVSDASAEIAQRPLREHGAQRVEERASRRAAGPVIPIHRADGRQQQDPDHGRAAGDRQRGAAPPEPIDQARDQGAGQDRADRRPGLLDREDQVREPGRGPIAEDLRARRGQGA